MSRIVAGSRGGRRLVQPDGSATRPTTDRVREALFSAVVAWAGRSSAPADEALVGLAFADLYAGSGAVGLEAASRGAHPVLLVEGSLRAARAVARNVASLGLVAELRTARVERELGRVPARRFDVVFADPPYDLSTAAVEDLLARVAADWLAPDGLLVVERSSRSAPPAWPPGVETWTRRYGETELHFGAR